MGLGSGLDGRWVGRVHGRDVYETEAGTCIRLPNREVPCRAAYEARLKDLALIAGPDELLIGGTSVAPDRFARMQSQLTCGSNGLRLTASRLRATWLVDQLATGTRLPELMAAAGLVTAGVLGDLVPYITPLSSDPERAQVAAVRMLRDV